MEAVVQTPARTVRSRTPAAKVREELCKWVRHKTDVTTAIEQCRNEITLLARPKKHAICKGGSPHRLEPVQQEDFCKFVMRVAQEQKLTVEPMVPQWTAGYTWEAFKLTMPPQEVH